MIHQDETENVVKHVRFAIGVTAIGMGCGGAAWVKCGALR